MIAITRFTCAFLTIAIFVACTGRTAAGTLTITPAGAAQGFSISTFTSGYPTGPLFGEGPLGIAFPTSGGVLVSDNSGDVRFFPTDVDGQTIAAATVTTHYGTGNAVGMATTPNGNIYMTQYTNGQLVQLNPNGTLNQVIIAPFAGSTPMVGLVANPATGHLFVSTLGTNNIFEIDPIARTANVFFNGNADGLALSVTRNTLYGAASDGHIHGVNLTTHLLNYDSGPIGAAGIDGIVLGTGSLSNDLFINSNDGTVIELDLNTNIQTLIANHGTRGDFAFADPNGTLLVTQANEIDRLVAPAGGGFGSDFAATPEPGTWSLFGLGVAGLLGFGWRRRAARRVVA